MVELHPWMGKSRYPTAPPPDVMNAVESMMLDPLASLLALAVLLIVVLILGRSVLTWGVIRARMWQQAYPWWDLKPKARLRYALLHVLYFFIGATIMIWGLVITVRQAGRPASFTVANFVLTWIGAVRIGALLMVPPRAIAYIWHMVEQRNRSGPIQPSTVPLAPNPPPIVPPDSGSAGGLPQ